MEEERIILRGENKKTTILDILPGLTELERQSLVEKASSVEVTLNGYRAILAGWKMPKASIATVQFYGGMGIWVDWEKARSIVEEQQGQFYCDRPYWDRWGTGVFLETEIEIKQ